MNKENFIIIFLLFFIFTNCVKKENILKYNVIDNSLELQNQNYIIKALAINTIDGEGVEKEIVGLEYKKKDTIYKIGLDTIFTNKNVLDSKKIPYDISVLIKHIDRKDTLISDFDKYKLMSLTSKEIHNGQTDFRNLLR